jgi:hypothetical protein
VVLGAKGNVLKRKCSNKNDGKVSIECEERGIIGILDKEGSSGRKHGELITKSEQRWEGKGRRPDSGPRDTHQAVRL